jgi:alkanesulfonate monooxygenase SsuD/methylene tetrahydromethanopterin reductase-like flavin-dependent oxidoreductase (luciferase family)
VGFSVVMIAQHIINPLNNEYDQLETWTVAAALAEATEQIELGDYDTVARRVVTLVEAGIEIFLLQFQPLKQELRRFAEEIIPRVRYLQRDCAVAREEWKPSATAPHTS